MTELVGAGDVMNQNDYQKWAEAARQWQIEKDRIEKKIRSIRLGDGAYGREVTFEDRLTAADRKLLEDMGIAI